MSLFDDMRDIAWRVVSTIYADTVTYRPGSGGSSAVECLVSVDDFTEPGVTDKVVYVEVSRDDVSEPAPEDTLTFATGAYAGTWIVDEITSQDVLSTKMIVRPDE